MTQSQERCSLTVLTEPQPFIYRDEAIAAAISRTYPELIDKSDGRYDLLSVPSLKYLPKNRELQDAVVSDLLTAIDQRKSDYLLVVTADHGENLGDHGHLDHVFSLYNTTLRVPLLIRLPFAVRGGTVYRYSVARLLNV